MDKPNTKTIVNIIVKKIENSIDWSVENQKKTWLYIPYDYSRATRRNIIKQIKLKLENINVYWLNRHEIEIKLR